MYKNIILTLTAICTLCSLHSAHSEVRQVVRAGGNTKFTLDDVMSKLPEVQTGMYIGSSSKGKLCWFSVDKVVNNIGKSPAKGSHEGEHVKIAWQLPSYKIRSSMTTKTDALDVFHKEFYTLNSGLSSSLNMIRGQDLKYNYIQDIAGDEASELIDYNGTGIIDFQESLDIKLGNRNEKNQATLKVVMYQLNYLKGMEETHLDKQTGRLQQRRDNDPERSQRVRCTIKRHETNFRGIPKPEDFPKIMALGKEKRRIHALTLQARQLYVRRDNHSHFTHEYVAKIIEALKSKYEDGIVPPQVSTETSVNMTDDEILFLRLVDVSPPEDIEFYVHFNKFRNTSEGYEKEAAEYLAANPVLPTDSLMAKALPGEWHKDCVGSSSGIRHGVKFSKRKELIQGFGPVENWILTRSESSANVREHCPGLEDHYKFSQMVDWHVQVHKREKVDKNTHLYDVSLTRVRDKLRVYSYIGALELQNGQYFGTRLNYEEAVSNRQIGRGAKRPPFCGREDWVEMWDRTKASNKKYYEVDITECVGSPIQVMFTKLQVSKKGNLKFGINSVPRPMEKFSEDEYEPLMWEYEKTSAAKPMDR